MRLSSVLTGYWLANRIRLSKRTIAHYELVHRYLQEHFGDIEFDQITADDIRRFLYDMQQARNWSARTVNDTWAILSSLWTWAEKELHITHAVRNVARPKYYETQSEPFTLEEVKKLIATAEYGEVWATRTGKTTRSKRPTALRDKALLFILLDTGLRVQELCDLTCADYEQKQGRLTVRAGKGNKKRVVYLGQRSGFALWRYLSTRDTPVPAIPLIASKAGNPLRRENIAHMLRRFGEQAGVAHVYPHRFRHTFAVTFLRNGGNVFVLQRLLGHERIETTMRYVKLAGVDLETAHAQAGPVDNWRL